MTGGTWATAGRGPRFVRWLSGLFLRSQYRSLEVSGADRVPREGPLLVVANHFTSLVDSLVLIRATPRPVAFLAKAPLWNSAVLRPLLDASRAVPVYRAQDLAENKGHGTRANLEVFEACHRRLAEGQALAIFPEGTSQAGPRLMPLRAGAARLALDLKAPLHVLPAGVIVRPSPTGGRDRVLVRFGEPIPVDGGPEGRRRRGALREVTRRIEEALRALLLDASTLSEAELLHTMRIVWDQEHDLPPPRSLEEEHVRVQAFAATLKEMKSVDPVAMEDVRSEAEKYVAALSSAGVPPRLLERRYSWRRVLAFALLEAPLLVLTTPLALLAGAVTWPARFTGEILALRAYGGGADVRAFCRLAGGMFLVGGLAVVLLLLGLLLGGWRWGLAGLLLPLLSFAFWVSWNDRRLDASARARCFFLLAGGTFRQSMRDQRRALVERFEALEARRREARASPPETTPAAPA